MAELVTCVCASPTPTAPTNYATAGLWWLWNRTSCIPVRQNNGKGDLQTSQHPPIEWQEKKIWTNSDLLKARLVFCFQDLVGEKLWLVGWADGWSPVLLAERGRCRLLVWRAVRVRVRSTVGQVLCPHAGGVLWRIRRHGACLTLHSGPAPFRGLVLKEVVTKENTKMQPG